MNDTVRTFPRDVRSAFREWHENAGGIDGPVIPQRKGLRALLADLLAFLWAPSPYL